MNRFVRKRRITIKRRNVIITIFILIVISIIIVFNFINSKVTPFFLDLAESETEKLATLIINDAVGKQVSDNLTSDNLFNILLFFL